VRHFAGKQTVDIDFDVPPNLVFHNPARGDLSAEQLRDRSLARHGRIFSRCPGHAKAGRLLPYD